MMHQPREVEAKERLMTFRVGGAWLAVRLGQLDRVALAEKLWGVPLAWSNHLGLFDDGQELVPVLRLPESNSASWQGLIAIVRMREERIGVAIEQAGRLYDAYSMESRNDTMPAALQGLPLTPGRNVDTEFWLLDTDLLWRDEPARVAG